MFDSYEPRGEPRCPWCSERLRTWQGKEAFNKLLVYREGERAPIDQRVDDQWRLSREELALRTLPHDVRIYSSDCKHAPVSAIAVVRDGVWVETVWLPVRASVRDDWRVVEEDDTLVAIDPRAPILFIDFDVFLSTGAATLAAAARDHGAEVVAIARAGTLSDVRRDLAKRGVCARVVGVARPNATEAWLARYREVTTSFVIETSDDLDVASALMR